jgi:DNA-binding NarL/FixJ family response regulator
MVIRVAIIEDQRIVRDLLQALLAREPGIEVVGVASTGGEALQLADRLAPDVISLDVSLPDMDGIAVARAVHVRHPRIHVVALSMHEERSFVSAMLDAGAEGYVVKSGTIDELCDAIRSVAQGRRYLSPALAGRPADPASLLSRREREVIALLADGKRSADIGRRLGISAATVEVHRRNIMRKLDLHTIAELTRYALRRGLTSL